MIHFHEVFLPNYVEPELRVAQTLNTPEPLVFAEVSDDLVEGGGFCVCEEKKISSTSPIHIV